MESTTIDSEEVKSGSERTDSEEIKQEKQEEIQEQVQEQEDSAAVIEEEIVRDIEQANRLKVEGNELYKKGEFEAAIENYKGSINYCPLDECFNKERAIFFCNMGAAQIELKQYEEAVESCTRSAEMNPSYVKAYIRRSQAYLALEKLDDCLADYDKILELDPSLSQYESKRKRLAKQIEERNEKLKEEMLGKLKDVGNKILGKFGMSLDNFKMEKDPATGGYSIKFEKWFVFCKQEIIIEFD